MILLIACAGSPSNDTADTAAPAVPANGAELQRTESSEVQTEGQNEAAQAAAEADLKTVEIVDEPESADSSAIEKPEKKNESPIGDSDIFYESPAEEHSVGGADPIKEKPVKKLPEDSNAESVIDFPNGITSGDSESEIPRAAEDKVNIVGGGDSGSSVFSTESSSNESSRSENGERPQNPLLTEDQPYDFSTESTVNAPEPIESGTDEALGHTDKVSDTAETFSESPSVVRSPAASPGESEIQTRYPASSAEAPDRTIPEPGEISVILQGQGWVFRSDLSTPGPWRFLDRERDGDSTRFLFEFSDTGRWNLVFERQDLSSGGSERAVRIVGVGENHISSDEGLRGNGGESNGFAGIESAKEAAESGRIGEALELLEREASSHDEKGRRARAALMELAARSGSTAQLITWLPSYIEDGAEEDVLAQTVEILEKSAGYAGQRRLALESLAAMDESERTPEWLYKLASSLEKPGEGRDMDRAAELYRKVITDWPLSKWKDLSQERLSWLQRQYFRVR